MGNPDSSFTKVADTSEIPSGKMKMVKIKDEEILIANIDNVFYAVANRCSHRGEDLSKGSLVGKILTCPTHGSKFDIKNGKNVSGPKLLMFRGKTDDLKTYELKVDGTSILVYQRSSWGV
jgi:nitrite reductase/ring-hydroxylating ferredoxin subunit